MRLAILTGGGDCPGLNAAIRAVVRRAVAAGDRVFGIHDGFEGLLRGRIEPLPLARTSGILPLGGTLLGGSRVNPLKVRGGVERSLRFFKRHRLQALVVVGGEGTVRIASAFAEAGLPIVVIPKTIDNDTWGTDFSIGFWTAVEVATEAVDRLHTTAESHDRVMLVEVMGRHAGWIATYAGIAGGADAILIPEEPFPIAELFRIIRKRARRGRHFSIFVVSEDARIQLERGKILRTPLKHDEYGDVKLGGIGELLARELRRRTHSEVRVTVLGHVQRGGSPCAFDRVLAARLGIFAVDLVHRREFGKVVALRGREIEAISLREVAGKLKRVDPEALDVARTFFG